MHRQGARKSFIISVRHILDVQSEIKVEEKKGVGQVLLKTNFSSKCSFFSEGVLELPRVKGVSIYFIVTFKLLSQVHRVLFTFMKKRTVHCLSSNWPKLGRAQNGRKSFV